MEFTQLRYFQTVAKTGNVSRASEILHVSQPNISKSIARLEDEIGVLLFEHRKGKITLNEYGRIFLSSVDIAFSELTTGVQTVQRLHETNQGTFSLACSMDDFLTDVLKSFSHQYPEIGIRQFSYPFQVIIDRLLDRSLHLAITSEVISDDKIVFELLGEKEYVILMHKNHSLAGKSEVSIWDLRDEKFICDSTRLNLSKLKDVFSSGGVEPLVPFEVGNFELLYQFLESNAGIAFVPIPMYAKIVSEHRDSNIRASGILESIPPAIIGIAYHKGYVFTRSAELFLDFFKEWLKKEERAIGKLKFGR